MIQPGDDPYKNRRYISILMCACMLFFMSSCYKEEYLRQPELDFQWNPEFAFPVLKTRIGMEAWTLELPVSLLPYFETIELQDTIPLNLRDFTYPDLTIQRIAFKGAALNAFNAPIHTQAYFCRRNYTTIDSLFRDENNYPLLLPANTITEDGEPFNTSDEDKVSFEAEFTAEEFDVLINESAFVIVKFVFYLSEVPQPDLVNFPLLYIDLSLGMRVKFIREIDN